MIILSIGHNVSYKMSDGKLITISSWDSDSELLLKKMTWVFMLIPLVDILINLQLKTSAPRLAALSGFLL